jgi:plastocyanin
VRAAAVLLVALLCATPVAQARHHHRHRLVAKVRHSRVKAPRSWSRVPAPSRTPAPTATPAPVATVTPTPTPTSTLPAPNPRSVSVGSTEYAFTLSQRSVLAGDVRIQFDNSRAEDAHQLAIDGPNPDYWSFDEQAAGTVTTHTVTLRAGTYVLFCPLLDHEFRGMRATLTVR